MNDFETITNLEAFLALMRRLDDLTRNPYLFTPLSPDNGWGTLEGLIKFVSTILDECKKHPDARIEVST